MGKDQLSTGKSYYRVKSTFSLYIQGVSIIKLLNVNNWKTNFNENKPKGLEVAKEDQIAHMPYGRYG